MRTSLQCFAALCAATLAAAACAGSGGRPGVVAPPSGRQLADLADPVLAQVAERYLRVAERRDPAAGIPRNTIAGDAWRATAVDDWTSGFFPGTLWYLYAATGNPALRAQAERWTRPLAAIPNGSYSHDLGFQFNSSFGNAWRSTGEGSWRAPALHAAALLAGRFNPVVGAIKSWDWMGPEHPYPVIADNMMNLELLFWGAAQPGGKTEWRDIAVRHARTTIAQHIRADGGSFHVVGFDPATGAVRERITHQGFADSSTWARGEAWLTYGFTMAFRETGEPEFLRTARRVADYALTHLPDDGIPCWDYQAPGCPDSAPRDASAAAITASALLELSTQVEAPDGPRYRAAAERILTTLASPPYLLGGQAEAALGHSVGSFPGKVEVDVGLVYADYYFVEALLRWRELNGRPARLRLLSEAPPHLLWLRGESLLRAREGVRAGDSALLPAFRRLRAQADSALAAGPFTVTAKRLLPPSGDPHDYASWAPYWWPDSSKADGLPYIRRDGEVNPVLRRESDAPRLYALTDAAETLALAWYFTGDPRYSRHAAALLRTWFLDPATGMNPHLRYAQAIPGVTEGRGTGIIDTRDLGRITDALVLLERAPGWTPGDDAGMRAWLGEYLGWLTGSEPGREEREASNNHGTWYDAQVSAIALFTGDTSAARAALARLPARIAGQIDAAGRLPLELARTRSLHYSAFTLEAFTNLAELARHIGTDLWHWRAPTGGSIAAAIAYLAPFADPATPWPLAQVLAPPPDLLVPLLFRADAALDGHDYSDVIRRLPPELTRAHRARLLYASPAQQPVLRPPDGGGYIATEFLRPPNKVPPFAAGNLQPPVAQPPAPGRQQTFRLVLRPGQAW